MRPLLLPEDLTPDPESFESIETAPPAALRTVQTRRMAWSLRHGFERVAHLRAAFEAAGVHPDDFVGIEDLARFPFTSAAELRAAGPFGMLAVPRVQVARLFVAPEPVGRPVAMACTAKDLESWAWLVARGIRAAGGQPSMLALVALAGDDVALAHAAVAGAEKFGCTVVPATGLPVEALARLVEAVEPGLLITTAVLARALLPVARAPGLRLVMLAGAPDPELAAAIGRGWGAHALAAYGPFAMMGLGVAQQGFGEAEALHVWEDHWFPEAIDRQGRVLPMGEVGELVFTSLSREAMPLVRYRTGHRGSLVPGSTRTMRRVVLDGAG